MFLPKLMFNVCSLFFILVLSARSIILYRTLEIIQNKYFLKQKSLKLVNSLEYSIHGKLSFCSYCYILGLIKSVISSSTLYIYIYSIRLPFLTLIRSSYSYTVNTWKAGFTFLFFPHPCLMLHKCLHP